MMKYITCFLSWHNEHRIFLANISSKYGFRYLSLSAACIFVSLLILAIGKISIIWFLGLFVIPLCETWYRMFCIWLMSLKDTTPRWYYINRQDEAIPYINVVGFTNLLIIYEIIVISGGILLIINKYFMNTGLLYFVIIICMLVIPGLFSLFFKSSLNKGKYCIIRPGALFSFSLIILLITMFPHVEIMQCSFPCYIFDYIILGFLSFLLFMIAISILYFFSHRYFMVIFRNIILDEWKCHFDFVEKDQVYSEFSKKYSLNIIKKYSRSSRELRNAIHLNKKATEFKISSVRNGVVTGILVEGCNISKLQGNLTVRFNDYIALRRPVSSFSHGWNTFIDLHKIIDEPIAIQNISYGAFNDIVDCDDITFRVENDAADCQVYLQCPYVMKNIKEPHTIILLIVDALRKDFIGLYGERNINTPNIDSYFKDGYIYTNAWTQGEWTTSNFAHMFTSLYSSHHKSVHRYDGYKKPLPEDQETFAEVFQRNGWNTYFFSGTQRVTQSKGYDRGFSYMSIYPYFEIMNHDIVYNCINKLDMLKSENNLIILHVFDVHGPPVFWSYRRDCHARFRQVNRRDIFRNTYPDEFVNLNRSQAEEFDLGISLLLSYINQPYWSDKVSVILTADHGQIPGPSDSDQLSKKDPLLGDVMLNVPMLVRCPWKKSSDGVLVDGIIEAGIDLFPSLLDIGGLDGTHSPYSMSFIPQCGKNIAGKEYAITESIYEGTVQQVIRKPDKLYYKKYNWRNSSTEEDMWHIRPKKNYVPMSEDEKLHNIKEFHDILDNLNLVNEKDDPVDYYGSY